MLPTDYMLPCLAQMEELVQNYHSSLVLCTATQPALEGLFQKKWNIRELCPQKEEQFAFFKRTEFILMGKVSTEELEDRLIEETQALCIVNTKARAQSLYQRLKERGAEHVYHLSTAMYPKHRKEVLEEVRQRLKGSDECILIATSLIEAGVDVDFRSVYRQLAGIDSIVQAAGRCNREGRRSVEDSKVYIFTFSEKEYMPGQRQQMDVASSLMDEQVDFSAPETARDYFKKLYYLRRNELDKKKIMDEFQRGVYNFSTASKKFKLIDEHTVTIFIPQEEDAKQLLKEIRYKVYLEGEKLGALIGRRGETLDAIQQLTNYSINRGSEKNRVRVQVDAENYREKREQSLERLAEKVAGKVTKYRRNVTLEPMNAYERHVIHTALQDTPGVTTFSIGTEPNRRVVVSYDRTKA